MSPKVSSESSEYRETHSSPLYGERVFSSSRGGDGEIVP